MLPLVFYCMSPISDFWLYSFRKPVKLFKKVLILLIFLKQSAHVIFWQRIDKKTFIPCLSAICNNLNVYKITVCFSSNLKIDLFILENCILAWLLNNNIYFMYKNTMVLLCFVCLLDISLRENTPQPLLTVHIYKDRNNYYLVVKWNKCPCFCIMLRPSFFKVVLMIYALFL